MGDQASHSAFSQHCSPSLQKKETICLTRCRFIITYHPTLFLVTDTIKNLVAAWKEEGTLPSKVLLIPLWISPACDLGLSEPSFLRTKNPFADLTEHSQWTGLMLTQCATLGCFYCVINWWHLDQWLARDGMALSIIAGAAGCWLCERLRRQLFMAAGSSSPSLCFLLRVEDLRETLICSFIHSFFLSFLNPWAGLGTPTKCSHGTLYLLLHGFQ